MILFEESQDTMFANVFYFVVQQKI